MVGLQAAHLDYLQRHMRHIGLLASQEVPVRLPWSGLVGRLPLLGGPPFTSSDGPVNHTRVPARSAAGCRRHPAVPLRGGGGHCWRTRGRAAAAVGRRRRARGTLRRRQLRQPSRGFAAAGAGPAVADPGLGRLAHHDVLHAEPHHGPAVQDQPDAPGKHWSPSRTPASTSTTASTSKAPCGRL